MTQMTMKRILLSILLLLPILAYAQNKQSVVTLKNGTELKGVIKSIDPTDALIVEVAGVETSIKFSEVAKVEEVSNYSAPVATSTPKTQLSSKNKLVITDMADYPESFDLKIGNAIIKMLLVRGGDMIMGYNGRHSLIMKSEPIHKVGVTSFYMSESFVSSEVVREITGKKGNKKGYYYPSNWEKANEIVLEMSRKTGMNLRLPTEAEWEFAACSQIQELLFANSNTYEFCFDWFEEYDDEQYIIDPIGPLNGKKHVERAYRRARGKFDRSFPSLTGNYCCFRIVVKAKDYIGR